MKSSTEILYDYVAEDDGKEECHGRILASDKEDAKNQLLKMGMRLVSLTETKNQEITIGGFFPGIVG